MRGTVAKRLRDEASVRATSRDMHILHVGRKGDRDTIMYAPGHPRRLYQDIKTWYKRSFTSTRT